MQYKLTPLPARDDSKKKKEKKNKRERNTRISRSFVLKFYLVHDPSLKLYGLDNNVS